ncbi:FixH family protein [Paracoccus aerodenitrificans]|uniref:FixH family protein n=1 Tax=Paracoccus aerodenitrificans TaxID=3017781 RepID=UPI0022F0344C|nr:FixH family protein [Paracoccus aerodenitrificans]WBU65194.1 FixH family protein [Paracoccus aerodenitrificans]
MTIFGDINAFTLSLLLVLLLAAVFFAPFLLFTGKRRLGGRTMLLAFISLFGVIIGVNAALAIWAVRTFPGLEVANTYVASQNFDRERAAQEALGWRAEPSYDGQALLLKITDDQGLPAPVKDLRVTISRPTQMRDDVSPAMRYSGGVWIGEVALAPGAWVVHLEADAPDGTIFRQRLAGYPGSRVN